jgi:hypothetical protein
MSLVHAAFVASWAGGGTPLPALAVAGYAFVATAGAAAVVGLWRRAPWLRALALPWGAAAAALALHREFTATGRAPFQYAMVVVAPLLYLWVAREMAGAARPGARPAARAGA